ncbi:MAG: ABC transporter substrate-binding protein [Pseudonocardiaceae bacterium]
MVRRRELVVTAVVLALAVVSSACSAAESTGSGPDAAAAEGDTLVVAINTDPANLSPLFLDLNTGNWKVFSGLVAYDQNLSLVPDLASVLPQVSADGRTVTVDLRTDVRFHDGKPFTAADVVFTWRALSDPALASPVYSAFDLAGLITSVTAQDADTVVFQLGRVDPAFLEKLYVGIVPEHVLAGQDLKSTDFNRNPIGTGPYRMGERRPGERMVLEANPDYYEGEPAIKRVVYTFIPDENARASALQQGAIDVARLPPRLAAMFNDDPRLRVVTIPSAAVDQIALPTGNPVLADPRVRRAIGLAFDRAAAAAAVYAGSGRPAWSPLLPNDSAYEPAVETGVDRAAAAALLDEAGWSPGPDGFRMRDGRRLAFTVMFLPNITTHRELALALRSDLAQVGVDVAVEGVDSNVYQTRLGTDGWLHNLGNPYDPDQQLYPRYHSRFALDGDPGTNPAALNDPRVDATLEVGRRSTSSQEREAAYRELQRLLAESGAYLHLGVANHTVVVPKAMIGIEVQPQGGAHNFPRGISYNLEKWEFGAP